MALKAGIENCAYSAIGPRDPRLLKAIPILIANLIEIDKAALL
jgi:hypothetical protein